MECGHHDEETEETMDRIFLLAAVLLVGTFAEIASVRMEQGNAVGVGVSAATVPQDAGTADRPDIMLQQDGADR